MRKTKIITLTFILILFIFCTGVTDSSIPNKESITQDELTEMLTYLSSDEMEGRLSGERGCELAAEYIANEFEQYGLIPADNGSYYQNFDFVESMGEGENSYFNFEKQGQIIDLQYSEDYIIVMDSDNIEYEGEIAFVGYSITNDEYNDYENIDVDGKLVVALDMSRQDLKTHK